MNIGDHIAKAYRMMLESVEPIANKYARLDEERPELNTSMIFMNLAMRGHADQEDALIELLIRSKYNQIVSIRAHNNYFDDDDVETFDMLMDGLDKSATGGWEMSFDDFNSLYNMKLFFANPNHKMCTQAANENTSACEKFLDTSYVNDDFFEAVLLHSARAEGLSDEAYRKLANFALQRKFSVCYFIDNPSIDDDLRIWLFNEYSKTKDDDLSWLWNTVAANEPHISEKLAKFIIENGSFLACQSLIRRQDLSDEFKKQLLSIYEEKRDNDVSLQKKKRNLSDLRRILKDRRSNL
jgi:hypothetical protein